MLDVDVISVWHMARTEFAVWFAAASLLGTLLFVRLSTQLTLARSVAAAVAMTAASWFFVAAVPMSLLAYLYVRDLLGRGSDPASWVLPVLLSSLTGAALGFAVLAAFKQRVTRSGFVLLLAVNLVCVALAVYRMVAYINAQPPQA